MIKLLSNKFVIFFKKEKRDTFFCGFFALIFLVFFNDYDFKNISLLNIFLSFFFILLLCFALLLIFSISHKILKISIVILLFFSTINIYIKNKYGYVLDEMMIANALDSVGHINDTIDYNLFLYFLFLTIIPSIFLFLIKLRKVDFVRKILLLFYISISALTLYLILPKYFFNFSINSVSPTSYISSSYRYYKRFKDAKKISKNRQSLTNFYKFNYDDKINDKEDELKIVVVMGESLRSGHLQVFGYDRQTTPNLAKIDNLLKFRSQSFFTVTTPALTDLLSHRLNSEF
jgi:lipid A ethanolaminephosphotransferase